MQIERNTMFVIQWAADICTGDTLYSTGGVVSDELTYTSMFFIELVAENGTHAAPDKDFDHHQTQIRGV